MEGTGAFRAKILPYPSRRNEMDAKQRVGLLYGDRGEEDMEIDSELDEAEDCDVDHEEDAIEKLITRVSGQRCKGAVHSDAAVYSF